MARVFQLPDYPVFIGSVRETLPAWLRERRYSSIFILADSNAHDACASWLPVLGGIVFLVNIPDQNGGAERLKTLATCEQIWAAMLNAQLDRRALVVNFGGGVIGDMGGFCAAAYKRGVDFIQIPTTLLAMTDAAIGGKLGIDFHGLKNAIGVFKNPVAVFVDPIFLNTLPARELRSGFAEVIKHALIGDHSLWKKIQALPADSLLPGAMSTEIWADLLQASIAVKVRVVTEDPLEHGIRALLNFGHTIGHALESCFLETSDPLTHGEAVAIGMVCEGMLGDEGQTVDRRIETLLVFFPHHSIPQSIFPALWSRMLQDKKNASGAVRMAVPDAEPFSMQLLEISRQETEQRLHAYNQLRRV